MTAEGLLFAPSGEPKARVVTIPDADQLPEEFDVSQKLAAAGCEVLSPVLINREDTWSGNPAIRMTNQPHREFLYRMSFEVGRTLWGYETEKALAAVDYFARQSQKPIGIWGYGEGGAIAMFAAALDTAHSGRGHFRVISVRGRNCAIAAALPQHLRPAVGFRRCGTAGDGEGEDDHSGPKAGSCMGRSINQRSEAPWRRAR